MARRGKIVLFRLITGCGGPPGPGRKANPVLDQHASLSAQVFCTANPCRARYQYRPCPQRYPAHQNRVAAGRVGRGSSCGGPRRALFYGGTESSNPPRSRRESTANLLRAADDAKKCSDHRPKTSDPALYGSGPTSVLKHTWWHAPMTSSFVGGAPGVWLAVRSGFWRKVAGVQRTGLRGRLSHCNALAHAHLPLGTRVLSSRFNGA